MAAAEALTGPSVPPGRSRTFADLVAQPPQPLPEVDLPFRPAKMVDGEVCVYFSKEEVERSAAPFRFSMVLKFIKQRPSLDVIRAFIRRRWGLESQPVVSAMRRARNVFVRFSKEADFVKAMAREVNDVEGVPYRGFHWTPEFIEESEPSTVPVWLFLPGLPPNFFHESCLRIIVAPIGRFLTRDNATKCATKTDGARVCVEMDAAKKPISGIWIGNPHHDGSWFIEIEYETLPAYCNKCKMQGHNLKMCKWKEGSKQDMNQNVKENEKKMQVWKVKDLPEEQNSKRGPNGAMRELVNDDEAGQSLSKKDDESLNVEVAGTENLPISKLKVMGEIAKTLETKNQKSSSSINEVVLVGEAQTMVCTKGVLDNVQAITVGQPPLGYGNSILLPSSEDVVIEEWVDDGELENELEEYTKEGMAGDFQAQKKDMGGSDPESECAEHSSKNKDYLSDSDTRSDKNFPKGGGVLRSSNRVPSKPVRLNL